jgi:hypothetical protein
VLESFEDFIEIMDKKGHIDEEQYDIRGIRMDKDINGQDVFRTACIAQESFQRSKCHYPTIVDCSIVSTILTTAHTFLSIFNRIVPEKKMQGIPPSQKSLTILIGLARLTKKTHHHAVTRRLKSGGDFGIMRMAVSHGQYRDRRASNIAQLILVWLAHPLLPLFRRRAPHGDPLIPLFRRRAPRDDHVLPLFRRRAPRVDRLISLFSRRAPRDDPS